VINTRRRSLRTPLLVTAIAVAFAAPFAHTDIAIATAGNKGPARQADTDRFIVKFKDGAVEHGNANARQQRLAEHGRALGLQVAQLRRLAVGGDVIKTSRVLDAAAAKAFVGRLRNDPHVEYAEIDGKVYPDFIPNDSQYLTQWHYWDVNGIGMQGAWDTATGAGQVVAVIDTGITTHSELAANILPGYDFIVDTTVSVDGDGRDADPSDPGDWFTTGQCGGATGRNSSWHGTHVAGTIAAVTNNGAGVAGVAYNAKVQPLRVLGKCGGYTSDISDAIIWASGGTVAGVPANATPAGVANLSLGGSGAGSATLQTAINTATTNGTLVVVSAGNSNAPAANYNPSNCANVVTVAASGKTGARASYSNYGAAVEITAPGGDGAYGVLSTLNTGTTTPVAEGYAQYFGTSMAAPHVSGTAALVREASGNTLTPAQISALLQATARAMPLPCVQGCGAGLLDANAAAKAATQPILMVNDAPSADEGDSGTTVRNFTVKLSQAVGVDVTFDYETQDGTATAGTDFVGVSSSGVIPAGSTTLTIPVTVNGDTDAESDESFSLWVHNVSFGAVVPIRDVGTTTVINDETLALANSVPAPATDSAINHNRYFSLDVPAGASNLKFKLAGGSGDADMYVRFNALPTEATWTCRPYLVGNNETCNMTVQAGTWYVMLDAYEPYAGATITGSYEIPVNLSIDDASVVEGDSGFREVHFTVSLSQLNGAAVNYDVSVADGTASGTTDYYGMVGTFADSIPAGTLTKEFVVNTKTDTDVEDDETFVVTLSNATTGAAGVTITDDQGTGTITNDDYPTLSVDDQTSNEGDSGTSQHTFTVSLSEPSYFPVTFDIGTTGGTATADDDFASNSATGVTIAAGDTSATFSVDVNGDTAIEDDETYTVDVSNVVGATVADGSGTGTITNDDFPTLTIDDAASITEGDSGTKVMTFTATLSQAVNFSVGFDAATADGSGTATAGTDYDSASSTGLNILAGQTSKTFSVTVNGDTDIESDETVLVDISNASNATITDSQATGTITNDDFPSLSIDDQSSAEGDSGTSQQTFTVSLSQAGLTDVTFDIGTTGGSATADDDFASNSATGVTIAAGNTSATFSVDVNGDTALEGDEAYTVDVSNITGATAGDTSGTGTITNDDYPTISIADAPAVIEGNSGTKQMVFTVNLSAASAFPVSYDIATANGTASSVNDYTATSATGVTIPAGQTSKTFNVPILGDGRMERSETVLVNISNASGGSITDSQATGTITNDDGTLSVGDAAITEGDSGTKLLTFTVSLSQASTAPVGYNIHTVIGGSTATAGVDYVSAHLPNEVIPAGQTSRTFSVTLNGDTVIEPNELVRVLVATTQVDIADGEAFGTIINDDGAAKLSIADAGFLEGDSGDKTLNFTVSLSAPMPTPVTFNIFTVNGMAVAGEDFDGRSLVGVTIPAGQTTYTFALTTHGDTKIEGNETLFVRISNASVVVLDGQARGVLVNDDGPVLSISDATVTEGDAGTKLLTFTVSISKLATAKVTFNFSTAPVTATAGSDFDPVSVTGLVIPYGQLSRTVSVVIRGDTTVEPDETLRGNISLGNVSIMDGVGIGTITNDD